MRPRTFRCPDSGVDHGIGVKVLPSDDARDRSWETKSTRSVVAVEGQHRGDALGPDGEHPCHVGAVDGGPPDRRVDDRAGGERHEVVEHRDRLPTIHLRARRVDDLDERQHLGPHGRGPVGVLVQDGDRQPGSLGVHDEQPLWSRAERVDLPAGERHPRLRRAAADAAVEGGHQARDPRLTDRPRRAHVVGQGFGQADEVGVGHQRRAVVGLGQGPGRLGGPLRVEAGRPHRGEAVDSGDDQQHVDRGAGLGIAPRRDDSHLRDRGGPERDRPPPGGRADGDEAGGGEDEHGGQQPEHPDAGADRLLEGRRPPPTPGPWRPRAGG